VLAAGVSRTLDLHLQLDHLVDLSTVRTGPGQPSIAVLLLLLEHPPAYGEDREGIMHNHGSSRTSRPQHCSLNNQNVHSTSKYHGSERYEKPDRQCCTPVRGRGMRQLPLHSCTLGYTSHAHTFVNSRCATACNLQYHPSCWAAHASHKQVASACNTVLQHNSSKIPLLAAK
jgi:hypothetical protein